MPNNVVDQLPGADVVPTPSAVDELIDAYRAHVQDRVLPAPVSVGLNPKSQRIDVQPEGGVDTVFQLSNVLAWSYTLADVAASWWRTNDDRLHVRVNGRISRGAGLRVYGGGPFGDCQGLVSLDLDQSEAISLDDLATLIELLQADRAVAG